MAVYRNVSLSVAGVDVSSYVRSLAYNESSEEQDSTSMGDTTREGAGGLARWTIEAEFNQSFGTSSRLDDVFATRVGTTAAIILRPFASATAATPGNPKITGSGLITEYVPMSGQVGDQFVATVSIVSAGARTRAVA